MPGDKANGSGWRSRFGKKTVAGEDQSDVLGGQFNIERQRNAETLSTATKGRKMSSILGYDGDQHTSGRQRMPIDGEFDDMMDILDGRSGTAQSTPSPEHNLRAHRLGNRSGHSKLERTAGEPSRSASQTSNTKSLAISDIDIEETSCPVCLELLSFRLAGEKPHVTPACGHALHHACFTAVYGAPEAILAAQSAPGRAPPPGMCGVCRTMITLGDEGDARRQNSECYFECRQLECCACPRRVRAVLRQAVGAMLLSGRKGDRRGQSGKDSQGRASMTTISLRRRVSYLSPLFIPPPMSHWIARSREAISSLGRPSVDAKDDTMADKMCPSLSLSPSPSRTPSVAASSIPFSTNFGCLNGKSPSSRTSTRPKTSHTTCGTPQPWPSTVTTPKSTKQCYCPLRPTTSPAIHRTITRPTTPRTAKRLWKRFRQTELAGMMGVAGQSQQQHGPSNGSGRGRKSSHSEVAGDDPLDDMPHRQRTRDALREINGYSVSSTVGSPSGQFSAATANDDASLTYKSPRNVLYPTVKIRPEYGTVYRKGKTGEQRKQNVVCVVSVEMPSRRKLPAADEDEGQWKQRINFRGRVKHDSNVLAEDDLADDDAEERLPNGDTKQGEEEGTKTTHTDGQERKSTSSDGERGFSFSATPSANEAVLLDPFASVVEDIRKRIGDWKGHTVDRFGPLVLYDFLGVRQESIVREFYVYLFKEALLCVTEERKKDKTLAKLMGADDVLEDSNGSIAGSISGRSNKPSLKLKGRIWLRHIRNCQNLDTDANGYSLSIKLEDESLDHFVLCFKERGHREMWRDRINDLLAQQSRSARTKKTHNDLLGTPIDTHDEGKGQQSLNRRYTAASTSGHSMQSGKSGSNNLLASPGSPLGYLTPPRQAASSQSDHGNKVQGGTTYRGSPPSLSVSAVPSHQQWSVSGGLDPNASPPDLLPHTPIDLVIMVSIPSLALQPGISTSTLSSSAALKLRLVQSTLGFVISHLGANDRIALVTYNVGVDGVVKRTSLLNAARQPSREKLEQFIDLIGKPWPGPDADPFQADVDRLGGSSEQTDTVTAVNVGFDIVLQRKSKNPVTAMLLINDTADAPRRGQMDLVLARAEAAQVPVHCFGFGKSHDPSSLWLISNHTRGSYTFVKEWYQLRECVTGCVGSLMSVALVDVRLHISVPMDNHFKVRKVSGPTGAIVSSTGKDVDLELGELRFGDCKELFVELELDFEGLLTSMQKSTLNQHLTGNRLKNTVNDHYEKGSATDDFMQRLGLQGLSLSSAEQSESSHSYDYSSLEGNFIEEVAVLEVECGCKDPNSGSTTTRLPTPGVLTLEINANSPDPISNEAKRGSAGLATALADPVVTRRRLEILVSDMITRCLLLVSRRNHSQALTILQETRRIVDTVLQAIPVIEQQPKDPGFSPGNRVASRSSQVKKQKELQHRKTALSLLAILEDLDVLIDGLESNQSTSFERTERNFGAQQAMVLRDQKAWTSRSDTEWQFHCNIDNAAPFAAQAAAYALTARTD